jgi:glutathione S-transferase
MKLYGFPASPNTRKVRAVAAHLGIPLDFSLVDLPKGQGQTPEYLALNPNGKTPTLDDNGFILWESNAIMQYLAGTKANTLWPEDVRTRADITRWQCWQLAHWSRGTGTLIFENALKPMRGLPSDTAQVAQGEATFKQFAAVLDAHLAKRSYLVGNALTLADFSVASDLMYAVPAKFPIEPFRNVQAWYARFDALPAWRQCAN